MSNETITNRTKQIIRQLEWIVFNFPIIEHPKDKADSISCTIHSYCREAVQELKAQQEAIEELTDYIIDIENYHEQRIEKLREAAIANLDTTLAELFSNEE